MQIGTFLERTVQFDINYRDFVGIDYNDFLSATKIFSAQLKNVECIISLNALLILIFQHTKSC